MRENAGRCAWKPILGQTRRRRKWQGIYTERELQELVIYERARADRTGHSLSLVVAHLNGASENARELAQVIDSLSRSIRTTDHLGWLDRKQLGVVLPLTSHAGAVRFVETLTGGSPGRKDDVVQELSFTIHSYPDRWIDGQHGKNGGNGNGEERERPDSTENFTREVPRWKRALDIAGASLGLVILMPLFAVIALYIKLVSPGPILFRQERVGLARRPFTFYKFRTMHHRNDVLGHTHHLKDLINSEKPMTKLDDTDSRIIPGGRILRKLSVDEFPQIINILKGDMSMVGPRPCIPYEADEYLQWHAGRFSVLPGLTGLWQVSGKNKLSFQEMIRLDIAYENKMSLWFDLWIVLRTFPTLVGLAVEGFGNRMRRRRERLSGDNSRQTSGDSKVAAS